MCFSELGVVTGRLLGQSFGERLAAGIIEAGQQRVLRPDKLRDAATFEPPGKHLIEIVIARGQNDLHPVGVWLKKSENSLPFCREAAIGDVARDQ